MGLFELYEEIKHHLLHDMRPSEYLHSIYEMPLLRKYPFIMLYNLKKTEQSPEHHPEGNVWNHTLLVVDEAAERKAESKNADVLMMAALLHDIGKPVTTRLRKGKYTAYGHDKEGAKLCRDFLKCFTADQAYMKEVTGLVRYHMQILFVVKDSPFADVQGMKENTDLNEIALLGLCDRLGRTISKKVEEKEIENINIFLQKCNSTILG